MQGKLNLFCFPFQSESYIGKLISLTFSSIILLRRNSFEAKRVSIIGTTTYALGAGDVCELSRLCNSLFYVRKYQAFFLYDTAVDLL